MIDNEEEDEFIEVIVYDVNPCKMISGVVESSALDDLYINVYLDDDTIKNFPNSHVKPCGYA